MVIVFVMILGRMGKRKLRFHVRKNYERKKKAAKRVCTVRDTDIVPATYLMIKIPLSIYAEAVASDISTLHSRLQHLSVLPTQWLYSSVSETNIVLSQLRITPPQMSAQLSFLLTISESFFWVL